MSTQFLLYLNDFPVDVLYNITIYAEDTTLYSKCDLELASQLKSDLLDTIDWGKKQLADFDDGKNNIYSFDPSNNSGAIDVKMDGSVLEEKSSFKILGVSFSSKLDCGSYIVTIVKISFKKVQP